MLFKNDDDLFAKSTMTFGEHLEELRVCLFKAILGMAIAFIAVLILKLPDAAIKFIEGPLGASLQEFYLAKSEKDVAKNLKLMEQAGRAAPDIAEIRETITVDKMLPEIDYVDVRQVTNAISGMYGTEAATTVVPEFGAADILQPRALCQAMTQGRDSDDPNPGKRVWELLDESARELVDGIATGDVANSPENRKQLADAFRTLVLDNAEFYRQADFQEIEDGRPILVVSAADEIAVRQADRLENSLARRSALTPMQFNKLLLTAAFPDVVAAGPRRDSMLALIRWHSVEDDPRISMKSLGVHEAFMIWIKAALMLSIVFASPWVFWQIWNFVAAGLYKHERRYIHLFLPISIVLFVGGAALCFFFVFEFVIGFLLSFNAGSGIDPDIRISEWFGMALFLPIGFGISFQLPLVMLFLQRIGVFTVSIYLKKWKVAVLVICVISMLLTPADPWSMVLMAAPLVVLYFGGILMCRFLPRGRNPFREADLQA